LNTFATRAKNSRSLEIEHSVARRVPGPEEGARDAVQVGGGASLVPVVLVAAHEDRRVAHDLRADAPAFANCVRPHQLQGLRGNARHACARRHGDKVVAQQTPGSPGSCGEHMGEEPRVELFSDTMQALDWYVAWM
jgi:hypothetical protein